MTLEDLISAHRHLASTATDPDRAKLHYDTVDELVRLQADRANAERRAEDAESRAAFFETELERILKEGTRK